MCVDILYVFLFISVFPFLLPFASIPSLLSFISILNMYVFLIVCVYEWAWLSKNLSNVIEEIWKIQINFYYRKRNRRSAYTHFVSFISPLTMIALVKLPRFFCCCCCWSRPFNLALCFNNFCVGHLVMHYGLKDISFTVICYRRANTVLCDARIHFLHTIFFYFVCVSDGDEENVSIHHTMWFCVCQQFYIRQFRYFFFFLSPSLSLSLSFFLLRLVHNAFAIKTTMAKPPTRTQSHMDSFSFAFIFRTSSVGQTEQQQKKKKKTLLIRYVCVE